VVLMCSGMNVHAADAQVCERGHVINIGNRTRTATKDNNATVFESEGY